MHFFTILLTNNVITFVICMTDFTAKMLQVTHLVIRCEAKFSKVRLEIFKFT